ncbi:MAG: ribbon-helix-helix protein, CopG family [Alphaproteobacteria bacterium]|nr:ribbon-helix-helix protein, CopG family [Alphaproteobacteria bacterium]
MATLTIRIPENKADRLKILAEQRGLSVNKLMEELATMAIAEFDVETRFRLRAARGSATRGLAFLDELSAHYAGRGVAFQGGQSSGLHDSADQNFIGPGDTNPQER